MKTPIEDERQRENRCLAQVSPPISKYVEKIILPHQVFVKENIEPKSRPRTFLVFTIKGPCD